MRSRGVSQMGQLRVIVGLADCVHLIIRAVPPFRLIETLEDVAFASDQLAKLYLALVAKSIIMLIIYIDFIAFKWAIFAPLVVFWCWCEATIN